MKQMEACPSPASAFPCFTPCRLFAWFVPTYHQPRTHGSALNRGILDLTYQPATKCRKFTQLLLRECRRLATKTSSDAPRAMCAARYQRHLRGMTLVTLGICILNGLRMGYYGRGSAIQRVLQLPRSRRMAIGTAM